MRLFSEIQEADRRGHRASQIQEGKSPGGGGALVGRATWTNGGAPFKALIISISAGSDSAWVFKNYISKSLL
jgi:hypothetical protein